MQAAGKGQEWAGPDQRQKSIQQIEMAISQYGNPANRSSPEIEGQIFQRAQSKDEYFNLIARFILHLKEVKANSTNVNKMASQKGIISQAVNSGMQKTGGQMAAVQNLPNQLTSISVALAGQQNALNFTSGAQRNPGNQLNTSTAVAVQGNMELNPSQAAILQQQMKQAHQRMVPNSQVPIVQTLQNQSFIANPQVVQHQQQLRQSQNAQQQQRGQISQTRSTNQAPLQSTQGQYILSSQQQQPTILQPKSQLTPSPQLQQNFSSRSMVSPNPAVIAQSPLPSQASPSPSANLAVNPPSVGPPAQSPLAGADESAYVEKLKELAKYVEPLKNLINKMPKGEEHTATKRNKLVHIYEVFTNKRRVTMQFLAKCEQVVQTLLSMPAPGPPSNQDGSTSKPSTLQTVTENLVPLASYHTLMSSARQSISLVNENLSAPTIGHPKPPSKRKRERKLSDAENTSLLPDALQLEISTLCNRYSFKVLSTNTSAEGITSLSCQPKNNCLPTSPAIVVRVSKDYPTQVPEYTISIPGKSSFIESVESSFLKLLQSKTEQHSVTCILEAWEQSINDVMLSNRMRTQVEENFK